MTSKTLSKHKTTTTTKSKKTRIDYVLDVRKVWVFYIVRNQTVRLTIYSRRTSKKGCTVKMNFLLKQEWEKDLIGSRIYWKETGDSRAVPLDSQKAPCPPAWSYFIESIEFLYRSLSKHRYKHCHSIIDVVVVV